ncbi:MAG: pitrilysin family protein [Actinomycetota bacterium]|nr:pitrilysin family protein [Actinomycetota bacterium]
MTFYQKTTLDNGAIIVTERVPAVRSVTVGFWVGIGSRDEVGDENGMSHFIEHLLFKGTKSRSAKDISETFDTLGAELNAFTTKEFTCYYTRLLDDHLPIGVEVMTDMLQNSSFKEEHIDFERQVVLEEIAMYEDTPDELIHDLFTSALWKDHPLGRQVLGTGGTVRAFDRSKTSGFFENHYTPGNTVIAAAGNLDHDSFVALIKKFYNPTVSTRSENVETEPVVRSSLRVVKKKTEQVHLCYGTEALNSRHPDRFALSVLENILGGGMSSRLFQRIREERGLAYSVYSYHSLYKDSGNLAVYVGTRPANVNEVLSIIESEMEKIKREGVVDEELARAREHLKGQLVLGLESTRNRMTRLGRSELTHGEILSVDELVDRVNEVNKEQIKELANRLFMKERMVLTIIGPIKEKDLAFGLA